MQTARQLGFNILPIGFRHPKKAFDNPDHEIEWQVAFTKVLSHNCGVGNLDMFQAEGLLTRGLHQPKLRVYLFAVLIFKTYLEPFDSINELHIR